MCCVQQDQRDKQGGEGSSTSGEEGGHTSSIEGEGGSTSGEEGDPTSSVGSKGAKFHRELTLKI
jgi:hypothetical protein